MGQPGYHSGIAVSGHPETTTVSINNWLGVWHNGKPTRAVSVSAPTTAGNWNVFSRRIAQNGNSVTLGGFLNGSVIGEVSDVLPIANYPLQPLRIGAASVSTSSTWALNGDISEIIVYNKSLNEAERIIVDNYLSAKYHVPIENDKFAFDAPGEYPHQVAGIGRVDGSSVHLSSNSDLINVSNPSSLDNQDYILVGHNGQPILLVNSDAPIGMKRLERVWKSDVTGDPGTVSISFNINNFSLSEGQSFRLLVANSPQFLNASEYEGNIVNGVFTVNTPVALSDGAYLTLAYIHNGPSAPVSLTYAPNTIMSVYGNAITTSQPSIADGGSTPSFSLINPPQGISINTATGAITASGATGGSHQLSVSVSNINGSSIFNNAITLRISPYVASNFEYPDKTISFGNSVDPILPNLPPNAFLYSLASGSLNGLTIDANTGMISGTTLSDGTISALIRATPQAPNATGTQITTLLKVTAMGSNGPAGVGGPSNNKIWLDANYLNGLTNGSRVSIFADRSGNGWNAIQSSESRKPTFLTSQLNGKPVIRFERNASVQLLEITAPGIGNAMSNTNSLFIVAKSNAGARNSTSPLQSLFTIPGFHSGMYFLGYPNTTGAYFQNFLGGVVYGATPTTTITASAAFNQGTWQLLFRNISGNNRTIQTSFLNGNQGTSATSALLMTKYNSDLVRIGVADLSGTLALPLHGDIAEIIFYNTTLNEAQRLIVENYLSAKYNLPIAHDKYAPTEPTYAKDVQGIGVSGSGFSHKHSIASNSGGLTLAELNSSLDESGEFLFCGHNSVANEIVTTDLPLSVSERWTRNWYVEKTGSIDAKISFDISAAGLNVPPDLPTQFSYYQLLFRPSATGAFSVIPVMPSLENGDQLVFPLSDSQLLNGYYTLGYSQGLVWTGVQNEAWNQAANWNLNRVPTANDLVVINECATCPRLSTSVTVASLQLNNGSKLHLESNTLSVQGASFINEAHVESSNGKLQANDFTEVKNSVFKGAISLEKTGGNSNSCYGGNIFSDLKFINSSNSTWQVATYANNLVKIF